MGQNSKSSCPEQSSGMSVLPSGRSDDVVAAVCRYTGGNRLGHGRSLLISVSVNMTGSRLDLVKSRAPAKAVVR